MRAMMRIKMLYMKIDFCEPWQDRDQPLLKVLGEMMPAQLRETTMNPATRSLLRVVVGGKGEDAQEEIKETETLVESLMGRKAELRFQFIQENAKFVRDVDI